MDARRDVLSQDIAARRAASGPWEIDAVVLWCENSPEHARQRRRFMSSSSRAMDNSGNRYACHEELRWCLRSLAWCLPWLRRIHVVVADYQYPQHFLAREVAKGWPEIRVVHHGEFIPSKAVPSFNSQAIEACLHLVPGLADRFIYLNDDFAVGRPLPPSFFFDPESGQALVHLDRSYVPARRKTSSMSMHARAWCNNSRLLDACFGPPQDGPRRYPSHVAVPMLRESFGAAWALPALLKPLARTVMSRFRRGTNVYLVGFLVYFNLLTGVADWRDGTRACFFHDCEPGDDVAALGKHLLDAQPPLLCVNDAGFGPREKRLLARAMREMFPLRSPWE